jgi:hypothetical protein
MRKPNEVLSVCSRAGRRAVLPRAQIRLCALDTGAAAGKRALLSRTSVHSRRNALRRFICVEPQFDRRVPAGDVVRVTLHDKDGTVLFEGDVR